MPSRTASTPQRPLHLTKEEALALLDLCMVSGGEDGPARAELIGKLGQLCREFMREEHRARSASADLHGERRAFRRMLRSAQAPSSPLALTCT